MPKITQYTELTAAAIDDVLVLTDVSVTQTKKITVQNLFQSIPGITLSRNINIKVADAAALAALTAVEGMIAYQADTDAFCLYDGSAWLYYDTKWQSYTPDVYTNNTLWTKGNGTSSGFYLRNGKHIEVIIEITLGSTTTWNGGSPFVHEFTMPSGITIDTAKVAVQEALGFMGSINIGVAEAIGFARRGTTSSRLYGVYSQYSSTANAPSLLTANAPYTTAVGDLIVLHFTTPIS